MHDGPVGHIVRHHGTRANHRPITNTYSIEHDDAKS